MRAFFTALTLVVGLSFPAALTQELPTEIDQAITKAEEHKELTASFSMKVIPQEFPPVTYRFNAQSKAWNVIEGDESAFNKETIAQIKKLKEDLEGPGELTYADIRESLIVNDLLNETANTKVFDIKMNDKKDPMPKAMKKVVKHKLHLNKNPLYLSTINTYATKPFKPAPVAKINTMNISQEFTLPEGFETAVISKYSSEVSGSIMMQKFNETFTLEFFDHELIK